MVYIQELLSKYDYYKEPEGKDPVNKIMGLAKYPLVLSPVISLYDACLFSKTLNTLEFLNTAGYWMVPLTGMALAFSTVTYAATNIRKKDDTLNYALGALASGSVLHAWIGRPVLSGWGTILLVLIAVLKKDAKINHYTEPNKNLFFPEEVPRKTYFPWRNVYYRDYTPKPKFEFNKVNYYTNFY